MARSMPEMRKEPLQANLMRWLALHRWLALRLANFASVRTEPQSRGNMFFSLSCLLATPLLVFSSIIVNCTLMLEAMPWGVQQTVRTFPLLMAKSQVRIQSPL